MPILDEVTSIPLSEKLGLLKSEYPELKDIPDDHLISQLGRFYPDTLADPEFRTAYKRVVGQQQIASETPTEFLRSDRADFGDGPIGNVLTYLAPGGRAIVRGGAQMIDSTIEAQKALAAAPRVYLGANPITVGFEKGVAGPASDQLQELVKPAADAPLASAQGLKEAWQGGNTPAYLIERGLEQVPQLAASMGTGAGVGATGMAETIASLSPRLAKMGPEAISALIGTAITTFPQEMGGAYSEMKDQGVESPATAAAIGVINTFLEFGGDAKVVERALGGDRLAASSIREAVRKGVGRALGQGAKEAGVETAQELTTAELPVLTGQTKQMPGRDLAWRLGEAAAGGFLPGAVGAGGVDLAHAAEGGVISPPVISPEETAKKDLAVQIGKLREEGRAKRIQQDADDLLAQQMATARQESARQQALIQQSGGSLLAENEVKVKEALAHADALLQNLTIKRQSQAMDIPEVQAGIPLDPTSTTLQMAAEAQRRADMTPQQRAALEMLDRPAQPDVIPVNRLSPTPQQFDAALQNGLPPVQSEPTLQAQRQLGGRIAATPDTTSGLAEPGQSTIAPSPVDMLLAEDRGAFYPVPSRSAFNRGLRNGMPPVRRQAGPVSTDAGLSESQVAEGTTPVDQYLANPVRRLARPVNTDAGLSDAQSSDGVSPVDQFTADPANRAKPAPLPDFAAQIRNAATDEEADAVRAELNKRMDAAETANDNGQNVPELQELRSKYAEAELAHDIRGYRRLGPEDAFQKLRQIASASWLGASVSEQQIKSNPDFARFNALVDVLKSNPESATALKEISQAKPSDENEVLASDISDIQRLMRVSGSAPSSRTAKATEARRQKSALRRQESRGTRIEQAQQPTTKRQRGEMSAIPPRYGAMMERLNTIPQEEKDRASGISSEAPTTDEGWALREILHAPQNVELFLSLPENRGNANTAAYIERRYVERVLDTLSDPKRKAPLGPTLLKNRGKFFTQALISVRNDLAEVGQSGGQSEVPTEIETESGTITSPEVEGAPRAGEGGWFAKSPAAHNARELINEFITNETGSDAEERAALNLMARALGVPDVHTERDPDRTLAEDSPTLKAKVAEFVSDELRAKIVRAHLSGEERVPIGIAAVKAAVAEVTTSPRVQVISDPNLRDENGTPIAGFLREDGTVVLNSAFIDSPQMAREVLLEELMHAVYGDGDVQAAWEEVKRSVAQAEVQAMVDMGYSEDVAIEEAAIRKVISQINSRNAENVVMRFIRSVVNAIRNVFGVSGQDAYATILARALESVGPDGKAREKRTSLTEGRWKSTADLNTDVANAGDPATLKSAAAVQGSLIPDATVQRIDALVNKPAPTKAERIAIRILKPLLNVRELASSIWGPGSGFSGYAIGGSSGLSTTVPAAQDIAAESVIRQSIDDRARLEKVTERAEAAANVAAVAMSKLPQAAMHQNDAMLYDSMAKQLARDYQDTLAARIQTAKGANDTQLVQVLAQASRNLTQSLRGIGNAVAMALKNIAAEIPDTALTSHAAAEAWIQARVNNPTLPRIMSVAAQDWLFNPPSGRTTAPIQWDSKLHERLKVMKDLAASNSTLLAQIKAFNASITGGKAPSVRQVFDKYLAFRQAQRDAIEKMQLIFRAVKNAEAELQGSELAQRDLEAMVRDPDYQARVTEAARHLNASTRGVRVYERAGNQMTGRLIYLNPLTGAQVAIDTTPDLTTEQDNLRKIQALTRDVQTWMGTTDDVLLKEAWAKEMHYLMDFGFHQAPGLITGTNVGGIKGWSIWQLNPISRHVWRGRLDTRSNLARRVGERLMLPFQMAGIAFDHVQKGLENLVNGRDSEQAVDESTIAALKSHGMKPTQQNVFKWWVPNVLERIIAQNQNPTNVPYKVGDWVRGVKITKEDMAAAEQQKRHQFAVHSLLQRNEKDSRNSELWRNPVTTEEEVPGGRHLVRRSTDYGLKMARTLRDWAVEFAEQWVKADPANRVSMLDQHFQDVVMGLVTETNSELATTVDDTDRELFKKLSKMERDNTLPFSDASGFFDWMANERATLLGTSVAQERVDTEARFTGYVDQQAQAVVKATKGQAKVTAEDFLKSGMPKALVQAVAGKDNPFTTARGRMIAPSTWYSYSMTGAGDRAKYRAGALAVLTLREIEAGQMALAAIENELKKYEGPNGLIAQEQARTPNQSEMRVRMRVAAQSQKLARMGKIMTDYKSLLDNRATLDYMLKDMARLAAEHVTIPEDVAASAFLNSARQSFVGQMLSSARAIATNLFGAGFALSQFRRMIGSYRFMMAPASYIWELSKDLTAITLKSIRQIKGADATGKLLDQIPGVHNIVRAFVNNQLRYEQERMRAESAMVVDPSDWKTTARLAGQLKTTGGRLSEGDQNNPLMLATNVVSGLPVVRQLLALMKSKFPGGIDRLANTITSTKVRQWVNEIGGPAFDAWKRRDTGAAGWNDLTDYATTHFGHQELGLVDATTLKFWRDLLRPAGGLERLALDFYERTKAMTAEQRAKEPFLTPEQEDAVVLEAAKLINLPTPTTTHTISQGKGLSGTFRKWLGLFSRYPINANGVNELINSTVPGESPRSAWKLGAAAASIALLILLGSLGSDLGQYGDEIIRGEPRSRPTFAQTVESGDATDWAKYMGLSMAGIYPFWAEMISRAFGGTSNRPMMDATRMFVPFGIAADLESTAMRMFQTGDIRYPMEDFIRRYSPAAGALINMADPGDLASRSAARSIRVAAPSDMEIRQSGGAVGNRETPTTPLIRKAANALMVGDESTYQAAVDQAVQLKVEAGATPQAARQSVENQIASRDPAHRIFGRPITPQEEQALLSRMSPVQAQAFQASRNAFARFRSGGRGGRGRSSLRARGGAFGRQRKAFWQRRSAFRVR